MESARMNEAQEAMFANLNDNWGIADYRLDAEGIVRFTADDGDTGWIDRDGDWDWD